MFINNPMKVGEKVKGTRHALDFGEEHILVFGYYIIISHFRVWVYQRV